MTSDEARTTQSAWPHRLAVVLSCATFPLLWVGGLVTTTDAGMAVPDWPSTYGYNLLLYPWQTWIYGPWDLFIEHGHRLLGAVVGLLTIGFLVSLWRNEKRNWVRTLGALSLVLVVGQGVLGGMRVLLDERTLALVHGCTGPLFFVVCVSLAIVTSKTWRIASNKLQVPAIRARAVNLHAMAVLTVALTYLQLVLGALLRHMPVGAEPTMFATITQFHVVLALVVALQVVVLAGLILIRFRGLPVLRNISLLLVALTFLQIILGAGTWALKYSVAQWAESGSWLSTYTIEAGSWLQTHIVTAHVATGSLILATATALMLIALRFAPLGKRETSVTSHSTLHYAV